MGKKQGRGKFKFSDGAEYDGNWTDDRPHGYGVYWNDSPDAFIKR